MRVWSVIGAVASTISLVASLIAGVGVETSPVGLASSSSPFERPPLNVFLRQDSTAGRRLPIAPVAKDKGFSAHTKDSAISTNLTRISERANANVPDDIYWREGFHVQGIDLYVYALTEYNGNLIAGGYFNVAEGVLAKNIARWNGNAWEAIGPGIDGFVRAFAIYNGQLIVGGTFEGAGGTSASNVVAWDGKAWTPLGSGVNGGVSALAVYNDQLIVAGSFTSAGGAPVNYVARWDGNMWSALGTGTNAAVHALAINAGELIAGGVFTEAGGISASRIAAWSGASWYPIGSGMSGSIGYDSAVRALAIYNNKLIAGGSFSIAGGVTTNGIAAWDGLSWSPLGSGFDDPVECLSVYDSRLVAGGGFYHLGSDFRFSTVAAWNGVSWSPLANGLNAYRITTLCEFGGRLIAGGEELECAILGRGTRGIAAWDGGSWSPLGSGTNGEVIALTTYNGQLIAGGNFVSISGLAASVAGWNGSEFFDLGGESFRAYAYDFVSDGGNLYAAGSFGLDTGEWTFGRIARWDGISWSLILGQGDGPQYNDIYALCTYDAQLIAAGSFSSVDGVSANNVAAWNGTTWSPLADGVNGDVYDLAVYNGRLIVSGGFSSAGGLSVNGIAAWDGTSWLSLGDGATGAAGTNGLTTFDGRLIVASNPIMAWDGANWTTLGSAFTDAVWNNPIVVAVQEYDGQLIAGGLFDMAGGVPANNIAAWDGTSWNPLGSGTGVGYYRYVNDLEVYQGQLVVGGGFTTAGGKPSGYFGVWTNGGQTQCQESGILLCDDFEDGNDVSWTHPSLNCNWSVNDGSYSTSLSGNRVWCLSSVGSPAWTNYAVEAHVMGVQGVDKTLLFRVQDEQNFYAVNLRSDWGGVDELTFNKMENGTYTADIRGSIYPSQNNQWYRLKVTAVEDSFTVSVDGTTIAGWRDRSNNVFYSGKIAVAGWTGDAGIASIAYDNIVVTNPYPEFSFTSVTGTTVDDIITFDGTLRLIDGSGYVPPNGKFGVEDPVSLISREVTVGAGGEWSFSTTQSPPSAGAYIFAFVCPTEHGPVKTYYSVAISDPGISSHAEVPTSVAIRTGEMTQVVDPATNAVGVKMPFSVPPPPGFLPWEIAKAFGRETWANVQAGWQRTTGSTTNKAVYAATTYSVKHCVTGNLAGCQGALAGTAILAKSQFYNTFFGAFDRMIDIASNPQDPILTTQEADIAKTLVDAGAITASGLMLDPDASGLLDVATFMGRAGEFGVEYMEVLQKNLPPLFKRTPGNAASLLLAARDASGQTMVLGFSEKRDQMCVVRGYSPIDLVVTDPFGGIISKEMSTIPGADYFEFDGNFDGELEDYVIFPADSNVTYSIMVIPDPGAAHSDSFSVILDYTYLAVAETLAFNTKIEDIPSSPYEFETFTNLPPSTFNLLVPLDSAQVATPIDLTWSAAIDPNSGHDVFYDLHVSSTAEFGDTLFIEGLVDTNFVLSGPLPTDSMDSVYFWKVQARDLWEASTQPQQAGSFKYSCSCLCYADPECDAVRSDILDVVSTINVAFRGEAATVDQGCLLERSDVDCSSATDVLDVVKTVNVAFRGASASTEFCNPCP